MPESRRPSIIRRKRFVELSDELCHWRRTTLTPETVAAICAVEDELRSLRALLDDEARSHTEQCAFVFPAPSAIA